MTNSLTPKAALKEALPTIFGYIGISAAFGIIGQSSGLSVYIILLISIIVYAGAAQFVVVTMLLTHSPILSIILSVFLYFVCIFSKFTFDFNECHPCTLL